MTLRSTHVGTCCLAALFAGLVLVVGADSARTDDKPAVEKKTLNRGEVSRLAPVATAIAPTAEVRHAPATDTRPVALPASDPTTTTPPTRIPAPAPVPSALPASPLITPAVDAPPPGQMLHVVDRPLAGHAAQSVQSVQSAQNSVGDAGYESNMTFAHVGNKKFATKVVAIPVRVQADSRAENLVGQSAAAVFPTEEGDFWHPVVRQLIADEAITALVRELALQSQLVARDVDQWLLRVERESLNQTSSRERLQSALQSAGYSVTLAVEIGRVTDSPARRNAAAAAERQLAAEKIIFDDPFVHSMMRDFGAKIVPGSIKPA